MYHYEFHKPTEQRLLFCTQSVRQKNLTLGPYKTYCFNILKGTSGFVAKTKIATKIGMLKNVFPFEVDFIHEGLFGEYLPIL